ncbi:hypothetical protein MP638_004083 [Amoeboaphelidium occidentale]|nr:hypothetical protein MP638_004083 [Amoeboaphelidium occidentale]
MAYGNNDYGQCGPFNQTIMTSWDSDDEVLVPAAVPGLKESIIDIACGDYHNIALTNEGKVMTWGSAILGHGDEVYQVQPRVVEQLEQFGKAVSVYAAAGYSLVRYPDCLVAFGYLPTSKGVKKVLEPLKLDYFDGCTNIKQVSTSTSHFCVLHGSRMLSIFGSKENIDCGNEYAPVYKDEEALASLKDMKPLHEPKIGYNAKRVASCDNGIYLLSDDNLIHFIDITKEDAEHKHVAKLTGSIDKICLVPSRDALYIISRSNDHSITKITGAIIEKEENVPIDADAFGSCRDRIAGFRS